MKIFLSWSGEKSRAFAEDFKPWLEQVLPGADVWLSSEDIDKGTIWFTEIIGELDRCHCGIVCITRDNYLAPWIHFEAGGMIKGLGKSKVATILLDINYGELHRPLNQFNGTRPDRQGMFQLVKSFNKQSEHPIKEHVVDRTFEKFWSEFESLTKSYFLSRKMSRPIRTRLHPRRHLDSNSCLTRTLPARKANKSARKNLVSPARKNKLAYSAMGMVDGSRPVMASASTSASCAAPFWDGPHLPTSATGRESSSCA